MSAFSWIDHSEKQRRQILEAIDLFREKDTRDEELMELAPAIDSVLARLAPK